MSETQPIFTAADEPLTTTEIASRLNEPPRRVRDCYAALRRRLPNHENLMPLCANGRERLLSFRTANKIAEKLRNRNSLSQ